MDSQTFSNWSLFDQPMRVAADNITFTASQWSAFVAGVNGGMWTALLTGLIIGAIAGAGGLYLGMWYRGRQQK